MHNKISAWVLSACMFMAIPFTASADTGLDGAKDIVCAVIDTVACVEGEACIQGTAKSFDLPEFVILDSKNKLMRADHESGHKGVSPIKTIERSGEHLILQGIENGRGWNIAVDTRNGNMSGALVGDALSFLIFGNCTTL